MRRCVLLVALALGGCKPAPQIRPAWDPNPREPEAPEPEPEPARTASRSPNTAASRTSDSCSIHACMASA